MDIDLCGERLTLLPQHALYRHRLRTLMVADLHFGKPDAFRAASLPVPDGSTGQALARLDEALAATRAQTACRPRRFLALAQRLLRAVA